MIIVGGTSSDETGVLPVRTRESLARLTRGVQRISAIPIPIPSPDSVAPTAAEERAVVDRYAVERADLAAVADVLAADVRAAMPRGVRAEPELLDERRFGNGVVHLRYGRR